MSATDQGVGDDDPCGWCNEVKSMFGELLPKKGEEGLDPARVKVRDDLPNLLPKIARDEIFCCVLHAILRNTECLAHMLVSCAACHHVVTIDKSAYVD